MTSVELEAQVLATLQETRRQAEAQTQLLTQILRQIAALQLGASLLTSTDLLSEIRE